MTINIDDPAFVLGVVGAGAMGRGIAQIAVAGGFRVKMTDAKPEASREASTFIARMLRRRAGKGQSSADEAEAAIARIEIVDGLAELAATGIVVEAVLEDLETKQALFAELEGCVSDECILASNTSSLMITDIAAKCARPGRVAGAHFFNPVPLMKLVEVVDGELSDRAAGDTLMALFARMGHRAVRVKDSPGFLVNHAGRAYSTEALAILAEGVAQPADVDRVMREAAAFPMGPFELFDLTALDVTHRSLESSFRQYYGEPRFRPSPETARRFAAGLWGRKTGAGFYRYEEGRMVEPPEEPVPTTLPRNVWVSAVDPGARAKILALLGGVGAGVTIEDGAEPSDDALILVTPLGNDATTAAIDEGVDAGRTVAVDTVVDLEHRITLMTTPATRPSAREGASALFAATGAKVTVIGDSPGFIAQRMLASMVNIACAIAQARISVPDDIDEAVRIGRGYPKGPLSLGDDLGPGTVLAILENMVRMTGDPRYRPSPWLRRRAQLGVSLMTPDFAD
jgi:3-hydroxybutyryl-CoA dehydrogenase